MGEAAKIMSISVDFSVPQKNHTSMLPTASAFKLLHLNDQSSAASYGWLHTWARMPDWPHVSNWTRHFDANQVGQGNPFSSSNILESTFKAGMYF